MPAAASSATVSVQGSPADRTFWLELARRVEDAGLDGLYVGHHPGNGVAPFVALAAAAAVTERIRLGTCVVSAGAWEPLALATEVATLDVVSDGRAVLGIGAGHTPSEWTAAGREYPSPGERVQQMIELLDATTALLRGETVSRSAAAFALEEAVLTTPRPVQEPVPLTVGGGGDRVLRHAAAVADRVGITGLGRTLPDGHTHEVGWSATAVDRTCDLVRAAAAAAGRGVVLEALVQHIEITDDAAVAAQALLAHVPGASPADLLASPYVWIGTVAEVRANLAAQASERGITAYVVRTPALDQVLQILG